MTDLLEKAVDQLRREAPDVQDCVAQLVQDVLSDEAEWERLIGTPKSESWLASQAQIVREAISADAATPLDPDIAEP